MITIPVRFVHAETKEELPIYGYAVVQSSEIDRLQLLADAVVKFRKIEDDSKIDPITKGNAAHALRAAADDYIGQLGCRL